MFLKRLKISMRIVIVFSVILIVSAVGLGYNFLSLQRISEDIGSIYKIRLKSVDYLIEADRDAYQSRIALSHIFSDSASQSGEKLDALIASANENIGQVKERFDKFEKIYLEEGKGERTSEFDIFNKEYTVLLEYNNAVKTLVRAENIEGAKKIYFSSYDESFETMRNSMDRLTETSLALAEKEYLSSVEQSNRIKRASFIIIAATLLCSLVGGLFLRSNILGPVMKVVQAMQSIAGGDGDLTQRLKIDSEDELGELSKSFNTFIGNTHDLVTNIKQSSTMLVEAVEEISKGNNNLSQRTTEQATSLEEIAATLEESTANLKQNAENSNLAKEQSDMALRIVSQAKRLSEQTMAMVQEGSDVVRHAVHSISEVNDSSVKIGDILDVINEISFQTNLLALNAAVEAARAGEQGRGFAVVASEVRNLAQRTASSAKDIGDMIKDSIKKIEEGTLLVNKSGESLSGILETVNKNGKAMIEVTKAVKKVTNLVTEVAISGEEQMRGINQINVAVNELDSVTQQNAGLVEETASASEQMTQQGKELIYKVDGFKTDEGKSSYSAKSFYLGDGARVQYPSHSSSKVPTHIASKANQSKEKSIETILREEAFEEF